MALTRRQWQTASFRGDAANYKNIQILGEGNFGAVFLARDQIFERFVAIKEIGLNQQDVEVTGNEIQGKMKRSAQEERKNPRLIMVMRL